ncbi:MAG TPA: TraR/DksA C4-type zinc finger protein [Candidatus Bathyarchaeia archaeon]|nr:TraR/DksA C4-type zinc finger protein [Candidatus Bathyarchaeia archaeon]
MEKTKVVKFPMTILGPIRDFLSRKEKKLIKRKKTLTKEDPFTDVSRLADNAAPDTEAAEQTSHARVSAMKRELDRNLIQVRKALTRLKLGKYGICEKCGQMIDTERLMIRPEATTCVKCETKKEA